RHTQRLVLRAELTDLLECHVSLLAGTCCFELKAFVVLRLGLVGGVQLTPEGANQVARGLRLLTEPFPVLEGFVPAYPLPCVGHVRCPQRCIALVHTASLPETAAAQIRARATSTGTPPPIIRPPDHETSTIFSRSPFTGRAYTRRLVDRPSSTLTHGDSCHASPAFSARDTKSRHAVGEGRDAGILTTGTRPATAGRGARTAS